jgi:hypothetical protein
VTEFLKDLPIYEALLERDLNRCGIKYGFHSKGELLNRLDKWDFSNWGIKAPD